MTLNFQKSKQFSIWKMTTSYESGKWLWLVFDNSRNSTWRIQHGGCFGIHEVITTWYDILKLSFHSRLRKRRGIREFTDWREAGARFYFAGHVNVIYFGLCKMKIFQIFASSENLKKELGHKIDQLLNWSLHNAIQEFPMA